MAWVFDVSVTLTWCFDDERTPFTDALWDRLLKEPATVPQIWHLEIANVLTQALRRKLQPRITEAKRAEFLAIMADTTIYLDSHTIAHAWTSILELADKHKLSSYDAAYLELAMRLGVELATLDKDLRRAAIEVGVKVIP